MLRIVVAIGAVLTMAVTLVAQRENATYFLDIPSYSRTQESTVFPFRPPYGNPSITSRSHQTYRASLKVTLLPLEHPEYFWGNDFVYELLIENDGKEPVTLPWSPDVHAFSQPVPRAPAGFRQASIFLGVESEAGQHLSFLAFGQTLYGSNEPPGSLLPLFPGQSALVRMTTRWMAGGAGDEVDRILREHHGAVRLIASFSLSTDEVRYMRSNSIPVRVKSRLR